MPQQGNNNLGGLPPGVQLTGEMVTVQTADGHNIEVDSALAAMLKSVELTIQVKRADGTIEEPVTMRTEFVPESP